MSSYPRLEFPYQGRYDIAVWAAAHYMFKVHGFLCVGASTGTKPVSSANVVTQESEPKPTCTFYWVSLEFWICEKIWKAVTSAQNLSKLIWRRVVSKEKCVFLE